jgi:hypothetical protein
MKLSKPIVIVGWVAAVLVALLMIASGFGKVTAGEGSPMQAAFTQMGIWNMRQPIGIMEIVIAIVLLIPRLSTGGLLLAIGYWGGALATDLSHGGAPVAALVALVLLAVVAFTRNREVLSRALGQPFPDLSR